MSNYLEKYTNKLGKTGSSIHDSIMTNTHNYIQSKFKDSPTYRRATFYHNKGGQETRGEIDIRTLEIRRMGNIRNILLRPTENLDVGNILVFDDAEWLVFDKYGNPADNVKVTVSRINDKLRWKDANGLIHSVPCISGTSYLGSKSRQNRFDIEYNTYDVRLPTGQLYVFAELNQETRMIGLNHRFVFNGIVYEVTGIDNATTIEYDGYGVVQYTVKITTERETDDLINEIAENSYKEEESNENGSGGGSSWGWK